MRVLYFSAGYGPHDHRFLTSLARTKHEVSFLMLGSPDSRRETRAVPKSIKQVDWKGGRSRFHWLDAPALVRDLRRVLSQVQPDLVHAGPIQTCAFLATASGFRPVLTMSWGFDLMQDADRNAWWRWITRYTLRRSSFFTSDAIVTRRRAIHFGMDPHRVSTFPWGVDLERFTPRGAMARRRRSEALQSHAAGPGLVVLCNRSWEPRYGVDVLAEAFAKAILSNQDLRLILLGSGSHADRIKSILADRDVQKRVRFVGHVSYGRLMPWYRAADVFVSPSHIDGSSVSLMEALACGLPALVSDIPANREWVREGINGWLFPDGDADALAGRLLEIAHKPSSLPALGRNSRRIAEKRADWRRNFRVLLRTYERAAAKH